MRAVVSVKVKRLGSSRVRKVSNTSPVSMTVLPEHRQLSYPVRVEWGPTGAAALAGVDLAVIVDVLSFTTTCCIAVERGIAVFPFAWRDERAEAYARVHDASLAVGRSEQTPDSKTISLSPAAMSGVTGVTRIVLPSPNGSTISASLASGGSRVVAACLRNASAVADWLWPQLRLGATLAVISAGERWPDETLRFAVEDLWGAGAVIAAFVERGILRLSPEAEVAAAAYRAVRADLVTRLKDCASGRELCARGFREDVELAAELDVSRVVPVLRSGAFVSA